MNFEIEPISFTLSLTAIGVAVVGAAWILMKHYAQKLVDQRFSKQFEEHKVELQLLVESKMFEFQRMTHDFHLYRNKKHECYPELYKLSMLSIQALEKLMINWNMPNFNSYSEVALKSYLIMEGISEEKADTLIERTDSELNIQNIIHELKMVELNRVKEGCIKANDYFLSIEIFLSDNVVNCQKEISSFLDKMLIGVAWDIMQKIYDNGTEIENIRPNINTLDLFQNIISSSQNLKSLIKKELSIADYET